MKCFSFLQKTRTFLGKSICYMLAGWLLICAAGCTKNLPGCNGNCADVVFSGTVYDLSANTPLKKVDIKIFLNPYNVGVLIPAANFIVASGKTGSDGSFTFHAQYDSVKFAAATLEVNMYIPGGYIQYPLQIDARTEPGASDNIDAQLFNSTDYAAFRHLSFSLFEKALLQIHLHRTTPVVVNSNVDVELSANGIGGSNDGFIQTEANKDTTVSAYAAANVFTSVKVTKPVLNGGYAFTKDSIKCTKNGPNSIDIYY